MLILFETPAGYALFKILDDAKVQNIADIESYFSTEKKAKKIVSLQAFQKFKDTSDALKCTSKLVKGKLPKKLSKFLETNIISKEIQENLAIADKRIGKLITEKLGIKCKTSDEIFHIFRGLRLQLNSLISGLSEAEMKNMTLGLAHGLSRYKLKFSIEKVDTMIIQAISLLDDLDKEINNYMMRLREWYGWHFPELSKIITDNQIYTKTVKLIGMRQKASSTDLSGVLTEDIEKEVKDAAEISMGTEINEEDESYILSLCQQILDLIEYRESLNEYLKNRMTAIAPNLTTMLGELVGARMIAHAGSLINLAKYPASTVQILGAEKALFKAIRTKHKTPKYGIIYQAGLVGKCPAKIKGKISRSLAAKCSLCIRVDALGESENADVGIDCKEYIERRVNHLESAVDNNNLPSSSNKPQKLDRRETAPRGYNTEKDVVLGDNLPHISHSFKRSGQLLQEVPQDLKKKGEDFDGQGEGVAKKTKKIKK